VPVQAVMSAENRGNLQAVRARPQTPLGELTMLPQTPSCWGGGLLPPPHLYDA